MSCLGTLGQGLGPYVLRQLHLCDFSGLSPCSNSHKLESLLPATLPDWHCTLMLLQFQDLSSSSTPTALLGPSGYSLQQLHPTGKSLLQLLKSKWRQPCHHSFHTPCACRFSSATWTLPRFMACTSWNKGQNCIWTCLSHSWARVAVSEHKGQRLGSSQGGECCGPTDTLSPPLETFLPSVSQHSGPVMGRQLQTYLKCLWDRSPLVFMNGTWLSSVYTNLFIKLSLAQFQTFPISLPFS